MAADERNQDQHVGTGDDLLIDLASDGELDGDGVPVYRPRRAGVSDRATDGAIVHRAVERPLLPYQIGLCEALGISEDDYHEFLAIQRDWEESEAERLAIIRCDPVSIVLFAIGIIFQVVGALLAPKPEKPKTAPQSKQQRFSPRYGFNSTQELAVYGQPIPLVYCSRSINPRGVVRATTQLIWSAVESEGSAQFMQLLLLVGAGRVNSVDFNKTAFGSLPLGQFSKSNTWVYYDKTGTAVQFKNQEIGDNQDPARDGQGPDAVVHQIRDDGRWHWGYSQAHTPTSKTTFGCYSPIPINVELGERRQSGRMRWAKNKIEIAADSWDAGGDNRWVPGNKFRLVFRKAEEDKDNLAQEAAKDMRYQMVTFLDRGSTYQLGSAKFKVNFISDNLDLDKGDVYAQLECVERGRRPTTKYNEMRAKRYDDDDLEKIENALDVLKSPASTTTGALDKEKVNQSSTIFPFPPNGGPGATGQRSPFWFPPNKYEQSDEEQYETLKSQNVSFGFGGIRYEFAGNQTVRWFDDLDQRQEFKFYRGGSIKYTRAVLEAFLADKPKLKTKKLRKELDDDLEKARALRDEVTAGEYDKQLRKEAKQKKIAKEIKQEIEFWQDVRRWSEGDATLPLNDEITDLEQKIDDETDKPKAKRDREALSRWRKQKKELRKQRQLGDKKRKKRADEKIVENQELLEDFLNGDLGEQRTAYVKFVRNAKTPFRGLDGNRYACGIKCLKDKLNDLKGEWTTDQWGVYKVKDALLDLIKEKEEALRYAKYLVKNWEALIRDIDDSFFTKCLVKADTASYQTVTDCDYVKLNIRARLFRRIQGRAKVYGRKDAPDGYRYSDNGVKGRMAFFAMRFRQLGGDWQRVPSIFTMRRAADTDNFITLQFEAGRKAKWEFELSPILDPAAEVAEHGYKSYLFLENGGKRAKVGVDGKTISFYGRIEAVDWNGLPKIRERGPLYTNEWDFFSNRSDTELQGSFDSGPEFELVNVSEQQKCNIAGKYNKMSLLAIHTFSGAGVQDLRNVTAYVTEGKECWRVNDDDGTYRYADASTSWAPDIFADTVLDKDNGIGAFANPLGIDWKGLSKAKRFCRNNGLGCQMFMDGVIAERTSWREFWVEVAPYSLLEFVRINGQETLLPAIPVNGDGSATRNLEISALFNQGNILPDTYKEEFLDYGDNNKDLVATVIWRSTDEEEMFPRNDSRTIKLRDTNSNTAVWQTFDLSDWVTQRRQAELYARYLCQQRRHLKQGIEFKTVPTEVAVAPGSYIFVDIGLNKWDDVWSGQVGSGGVLDAPLTTRIPDGNYLAFTYRSGGEPNEQRVDVVNGVAAGLADREGHLFSLGREGTAKRVYRVTQVSMEESGEVTIKAVEHPTERVGAQIKSLVADFRDSLFEDVGSGC